MEEKKMEREEKNTSEISKKNEVGATMVEYAILVGLIAVVSIVLIGQIGTSVQGKFQSVEDEITN
jgi:Flp pilus assembly pilin Flp